MAAQPLRLDPIAARTTRIRRLLADAEHAQESALAIAVELGQELIAQKAALGHGAWLRWLGNEWPRSEDTAQNYIALAKNRTRSVFDPEASIRAALEIMRQDRAAERAARRGRHLREVEPPSSPRPVELSDWRDGAPIPWPDGACRQVVTSPPFALGVAYADGGDVPDYGTYRELMARWALELLRVTDAADGRLLLHVPWDRTRESPEPVLADWTVALGLAGWTYRTTLLSGDGTMTRSTAWGSGWAPAAVVPVEAVVVCYRGVWRQDGPRDLTDDELQRWGGPRGYWRDIVGEDDPEHPAVFDRRLVYRLLRIFSGPGDTVGDPFCGRGTVPVLAGLMGRRALACDRSPTYVALTHRNLERGELGGRRVDLAELHRSAMEVPL